ncbi:MAG TPA: nucleotidyltransferase domain-containing protein [Caulobacteraceae bacterium]|nr:nucleotidyltransferase domain-containing protein [Caulobacteraceae bacterium]
MLTPRRTAALAARVLCARYPEALCGLAAGSLIRGEGTEGSDLDLIVLFAALPNARRESFVFEGLPVDAFIHDPETLDWTLSEEVRGGRPAMIHMVGRSRVVGPEPEPGRAWRARAQRLHRAGPAPLTDERRDLLRYHIADRVWDLRDPRPSEQVVAIGFWLYDPLAELILRSRGAWGASGKWIPRRLAELDPELAARFAAAFHAIVAQADPAPLIDLAEWAMAPVGGPLFDGYASAWPAENRIVAPK